MVGVAAGLLVGVIHGDGAALRVGVEQQQRLEVIFDAFADHVLPAGADLQQTRGRSAGWCWQPGGGQQQVWGGRGQEVHLQTPAPVYLLTF